MKNVTNQRHRYYIHGSADITIRGLKVPHDSYLYSDIVLFTAADKSAHATLMHDTNLSLNGTWTIDTTNTTAVSEVTGLAGVVSGTSVILSWVDPTNADLKEISITHNQTGGDTPVVVAKGVQTKTFTGLTAGTAYIFTVKTTSTKPVLSTGATVTKTPSDAVAPVDCTKFNVQRSVVLGTKVFFTWTDSVAADLDHVEITHNQTGGGTASSVAAGAQAYTKTGLTAGTTYIFTLKAVDAAGNKSAGITVEVTPFADVTAPANVTSLAASNGVLSSALTWVDPVNEDLDHLEVTWDNGGSAIQKVACSALGYAATALTADTLYTFTVKSVDKAGNKSAGATITATPTAA